MLLHKILLIGDVSNDTSLIFVKKLAEEAIGPENVITINFGDFGDTLTISFSELLSNVFIASVHNTGLNIDLSQVAAVWFRRYQIPKITNDTPERHKDITQRNWDHVFYALSYALPNAKWINIPTNHFNANYKIRQLIEAKNLGLNIPNTLITNSYTSTANFFHTTGNNAICKLLLSSYGGFGTKTVLIDEKMIENHNASIAVMPLIFQDNVSLGYDVRTYIIGEKVYSAFIDTKSAGEDIDWRTSPNCEWNTYELPSDISDKCLDLTRKLGLVYAAIDLRRDATGKYIFFELNPGGQFLFVEAWTKLPIAQSIVDTLTSYIVKS